MTEAEAKTKWCPQARVGVGDVGASVNRAWVHAPSDIEKPEVKAAVLCMGSACMAWRWWEQHTTVRNDVDPPTIETVSTGYCGLAGAP